MEGTLRDAEQVAQKLMEESWFNRELGGVPLYRLASSESLSLALDNESPRNLGDTRVIETDVIQPDRERESEEPREETETPSETEIPEEGDNPVGGAEMRSFLTSFGNRHTAVEGGMETFKSETLNRINRLNAKSPQSTRAGRVR